MEARKLLLCFLLLLASAATLHGRSAAGDEEWEGDWGKEEVEPEPAPVARALNQSSNATFGSHHAHESQPPLAADPKQGGGGFTGSRYGGYNESCGPEKSCNPDNALVAYNFNCINYVCKCREGYVYIQQQERCFPVWKVGVKCDYNDQCHAALGPLSICNKEGSRCECHDPTGGKTNVTLYAGKCVVRKGLNEVCSEDVECQAGMKENAVCSPPPPNNTGIVLPGLEICQCKVGYVWYGPRAACFKVPESDHLQFQCEMDLQCTTSMGKLSRCDPESARCACHDYTNALGNTSVVFYKEDHTCYMRREWNEECEDSKECKASLSSKAECLQEQESIAGILKRTCQCPLKKCPDDAGGAGAISAGGLTFLLAFALLMNK